MGSKKELTIDDIARELGISKTTVSRAISGKGRISPQTRDRVQAHIRQQNYHSCTQTQLAARSTRQLALVIPHPALSGDRTHMHQDMDAVFSEAFIGGYNVLVCLSSRSPSDPLMTVLHQRRADAVILSSTAENDPLIETLCTLDIPFAAMGSLPARYHGIAKVEAQHMHAEGCSALTEMLISGTGGKMALLGNDIHDITNQDRLAGFRHACQKHRLPTEQTPIRMGLDCKEKVMQAVDTLTAAGVRCFLCMDSRICMQVVSHLEALGMDIPHVAKVASCCDSPALASYRIPITALHFDHSALAQTTCRELLHALHGEPYEPNPKLDYEILLRKSTG